MVSLAPGETRHELALTIPQPRRWSLEDPYLYRVRVALEAQHGGAARADGAAADAHEHSVRCGFRDFRVVRGFFHLNGKRVILRSAHTANHCPVGEHVSPDRDLLRRDLLYAKASGFNCVRFLGAAPSVEQLDLADEVGILIYQESYASWMLADSPQMAERFDRCLREMVLRDRNHPSVVIWGLLNETGDGPVFRHAVEALQLVRALDPTRAVLLNSGRFDRHLQIGSISNPGSTDWEPVWGLEGEERPPAAGTEPRGYPSVVGAGHFHLYPQVPHTAETRQLLRTLGQSTKPVFLGEYGIGSVPNVVHNARLYEQAGVRLDLEDAALFRSMAERFEAEWARYGMDGVYPFPEDMLRESQRRHARWRRLGFDLVRSNPQIGAFRASMVGR
jgi:hypothetical protein